MYLFRVFTSSLVFRSCVMCFFRSLVLYVFMYFCHCLVRCVFSYLCMRFFMSFVLYTFSLFGRFRAFVRL